MFIAWDTPQSRWKWALLAAAPPLLAIPVGLLASPSPEMHHAVYSEGGMIELTQIGFWITCTIVAGALFYKERSDRPAQFHTLWLGVLAILATARELDLHEKLNPDNLDKLAHLGVSYRIDWVLDGSVPLWLKAMWGVIFLAIGAALVLPLVFAGGIKALPSIHSTRVRLFAGSVVFLGLGFVFDDLLRHTITNDAIKQSCEETVELIGVALMLAAVLCERGSDAQHSGSDSD